MRGSKRRDADEAGARAEHAGDRVDPRHLEGVVVVQRRQEPREAAGEHRLADTRRARKKQVVTAGSSDLEHASCAFLPADVGEVGCRRSAIRGGRIGIGWVAMSPEVRDGLGQMPHRHRFDAGERDLGA